MQSRRLCAFPYARSSNEEDSRGLAEVHGEWAIGMVAA